MTIFGHRYDYFLVTGKKNNEQNHIAIKYICMADI